MSKEQKITKPRTQTIRLARRALTRTLKDDAEQLAITAEEYPDSSSAQIIKNENKLETMQYEFKKAQTELINEQMHLIRSN